MSLRTHVCFRTQNDSKVFEDVQNDMLITSIVKFSKINAY